MTTLADELATPVHTLHITSDEGVAILYGFHLGTDREEAKKHAEEILRHRRTHGKIREVELRFDGHFVGSYDGESWYTASDAILDTIDPID